MVTRKPVPQHASLAPESIPPYPTTPVSPDVSAEFGKQDKRTHIPTTNDSEVNAWVEEGLEKNRTGERRELPDSLRPGPQGYTPQTSQERLRQTTNPFLQRQRTGASSESGGESSASAWNERPSEPTAAPPPPPLSQGPTQQLPNLSMSDSNTNPWQPALDKKQTPPPIPQLQRQSSGNEAWSEASAKQHAPPPSSESSQHPVLIDIPEPESPAWDEDEPSPSIHELPAPNSKGNLQIEEDRNAWDDGPSRSSTTLPGAVETNRQTDGWNLVDHEPTGAQRSGVVRGDGAVLETYQSTESDLAPALPPRRSQENPPLQPPRPPLDTSHTNSSSITSPITRSQKKETYEIKRITWHDVTAAKNPRISPILVQNANGPCPLLALVNALTLSTPANVETALVETLRSRERVSLGLLLDAVFDELMSGRRGDAAHELPDVGDLYSFLVTLHTGMNVNPRFVPIAKTSTELRSSMSHVHPSERQAAIPGTFEDTREMKLYSTFSVPLIHGWLAERDSPAFAALSRSAKSYEDAQNLMFREEELEDKLQREGLSFEEQGTLEDIATIRAFFATNATQLTSFGLQTITTSLAPGAVAILFRNDHFSTLYRHPDSLQLLQLVTDMGYAGHEEVVWESLIDVNGERAEFFSGDFRLVGGPSASPIQTPGPSSAHHPSQGPADGWTTVTGRQRGQEQPIARHEEPPTSPTTEQEDHDLALALQLQEEEEERHRNEIERRRRETELSQQFIEQQANSIPVRQGPQAGRGRGRGEVRPVIPPRRNGPNPGGRPIDPEAGTDAPPPSYEQAANSAAYMPPPDHPAHPNANPDGRGQRRMSAYASNASSFGRSGRRMSAGPSDPARRAATQGQGGLGQPGDKDGEKCIVM